MNSESIEEYPESARFHELTNAARQRAGDFLAVQYFW
jgi:hypothetical protein